MKSFLRIPIFLWYCFQAYVSKISNLKGSSWWMLVWFIGMIPIWALISKYSTNLLIDGIIFDLVLFFAYVITFAVLGAGSAFVVSQWIGLVLIIVGFVLLKVPIKL